MSKIVTMNPEVSLKLLNGVNTLANAVRETLGPKGRYVIVENQYQYPAVTKDGVTVAKSIDLPDPVENLGAQLVKQAAMSTVELVGDGTTTSTILAQEFYSRSLDLIKAGINPVDIRNFLEDATKQALDYLDTISIQVGMDPDKLLQIATISANNDPELGQMISDAIVKTTEAGVVMVEESKSTETFVELIEGYRIDKGFTSPYWINNPTKMITEYENPLIFITNKKVRSLDEIKGVLNLGAESGRGLILIADEVEAQALHGILTNRARGFQVAVVKAPGFGERRDAILEDIAIFTGAKYFSEAKGDRISKAVKEDLGTCGKIVITGKNTTLVRPTATPEEIAERADQIRAEIETSEHQFMADMNKQRLASLTSSIGIINVGGTTELEMRERKFRVEDALQATQAAAKKGIVPGGGIALRLMASSNWDTPTKDDKQKRMKEMFSLSLNAPFNQIIKNAGKDAEIIIGRLDEAVTFSSEVITTNWGYNAESDTIEDLVVTGIIDPTLVVGSALSKAASIAQLLITTSATVCPLKTQDSINPMDDNY